MPRPIDPHGACLNACRITAEMPDTWDFWRDNEAVAKASVMLAEIEAGEGWEWEDAGQDWETACSEIASYIRTNGEAPSATWIAELVQPENVEGNRE